MNNQNRILKKICEKNFPIRLAHITEGEQIKYRERMQEELRLITKRDCAGIFLVLWETLVKDKNTIFLISGGMGGSLVAYLLGLTRSDPMMSDVPLYFTLLFTGEQINPVSIHISRKHKDIIERLVAKECNRAKINGNFYFDVWDTNPVCNILARMMEETGVNIDFKEANEEKHYNNVVSLIGHSEIAKKIVMLSTLRPASFGDYVNYICMSHSNIGWRRRQRYSDIIDESIITYEDAYEKFLSFGLGEKEALNLVMKNCYCLWRRAMAKEEAILRIILSRYKDNFPELFYKCYFQECASNIAREYLEQKDFVGFETKVFENEMIVKEEYTEMNINESFYSDYIVWSYMRREGITIYE